ncbi:TraR/DksA C4-type zinc finger protein [Methylococcus capsulatus]|uniref:TraR/DksA C4-type zinc finger protein n=1 Tax=Methylococcus capsulatus TaxID=414 RepID=UPI001C52F1BF|nr:TraR/DksA C4-type zinc finger protein [Methylococcus capsulatus]QXP93027.1 TraR/DksA C4-type zinc finger protein [Methylococcus capsulatus]
MPDLADLSDERIEIERVAGIRAVLDSMQPDTPQVVIPDENGVPQVVCYDCLNEYEVITPIPPDRLAANEYAIRCIDCQIAYEEEKRRHA